MSPISSWEWSYVSGLTAHCATDLSQQISVSVLRQMHQCGHSWVSGCSCLQCKWYDFFKLPSRSSHEQEFEYFKLLLSRLWTPPALCPWVQSNLPSTGTRDKMFKGQWNVIQSTFHLINFPFPPALPLPLLLCHKRAPCVIGVGRGGGIGGLW